MTVSCIVDSIAGKMGLVGEQNITNHTGVIINPTAQLQPATHVPRFKMLNVLDVVRNVISVCNVHQTLGVEDSTSGFQSRANSGSEMS